MLKSSPETLKHSTSENQKQSFAVSALGFRVQGLGWVLPPSTTVHIRGPIKGLCITIL